MQSSFLSSICPTLTILKVTGFLLFSIDASQWTSKVTKVDKIVMAFTILYHILLNFIYFRSLFGDAYDSFSNKILAFSTPALIFYDYFVNFVAIVWIFLKRESFVKMTRYFSEIDDELESTMNYTKDKVKNVKVILSVSVSMIILNVSDYFALNLAEIKVNGSDMILLAWNYFAQVIQLTSQIVFILEIKKRLKIMNLKLNSKSVKNIAKIHLKTIKIIAEFNEIFSPLLFLYFADFFCWLCVLIFDIVSFPYNNFGQTMSIVMMNVPHALYMIFMIYFIIKSTEGVKSEDQKLLLKVHENILENGDPSGDFVKFSAQIVSFPVKITCGLINFDWRLFFKVIKLIVLRLILKLTFNKPFCHLF